MSGLSNVHFWLETNEIDPKPGLPEYLLNLAKERSAVLTDSEVHDAIGQFQG